MDFLKRLAIAGERPTGGSQSDDDDPLRWLPPPAGAYPVSPIVFGYVSHQILNERIDGIPALDPVSPELKDDAEEDMKQLLDNYGDEFNRYIRSSVPRLRNGLDRDTHGCPPPQLGRVFQGGSILVDAKVGPVWDSRRRSPMDHAFYQNTKHSNEEYSEIIQNSLEIHRALTLAELPKAAMALLEEAHPFENFAYEDALALAAARWFKHSYFKWVDPIKCRACNGPTQYKRAGEPTEEEIRDDGATRVEVHVCVSPECGKERRFVRFNKIKALMREREGRCGEFAHLFYAFLISLGLLARYVWNSEDHVWCEYWSPARGHWTHVDPCEAEINKPLLYARGWGKKQCYCIAFGKFGAEDVSRAYIDDWEECRIRRLLSPYNVSSQHLKMLCLTHTLLCRVPASEEARAILASMDEAQSRWLDDEAGRWAAAEAVNLRGRQTGTEEWREERGETGNR